MNLKELIEELTNLPPDTIVPNGFGKPRSYRGYYNHVAFEPKNNARIGDMLKHAKRALGETFGGYKGGEYTMNENTPCWIAHYGESSPNSVFIDMSVIQIWRDHDLNSMNRTDEFR